MKWYIRSCEHPSKSSARELVPSAVSKLYSFSTGTQGSSRRLRASSSLRRVSSFSSLSSASRSACHSSWVPILCPVIDAPPPWSRTRRDGATRPRGLGRPRCGPTAPRPGTRRCPSAARRARVGRVGVMDHSVLEDEGAHPLSLRRHLVDVLEIVVGSVPLLFLRERRPEVVPELDLGHSPPIPAQGAILARAPQSVQRHQSERQRSPAAALPRRLTYRGTVLSRPEARSRVRIRLEGTRQECQQAAPRLAELFEVVSVSDPYPNRSGSRLVRVYVEVRLGRERHVDHDDA